MSKKMLVLALSLVATVLLATASFAATPCSTGLNIHYVGIGSSAQFNTLGYAASDAIAKEAGYTAPTNLWMRSDAEILDARTGVNTVDKGIKVWVFYDSAASCNVFIGYQADSVQGNKDFFCYSKVPTGFVGLEAGCFGNHDSTQSPSWELNVCVNQTVLGKNCAGSTTLPTPISTFLVTQPAPTSVGGVQQLPPAYCGQTLNTAKTVGTNTHYCYFNTAHTDVRPEDALFATTRALSSYNTTNNLTGLGYNQAKCGATGTGVATVGCPLFDAFGQNSVFFVLNFALSGADPYTGATPVPPYSTVSLGASPVVVFVNNADSASSLGFGVKQTNGSYLYQNINSKVLSHIFDGTDSCTGDVLAGGTVPPTFGGSVAGSGQPIQVNLRELLSGTYNTFEFTGVRTFTGTNFTLPPQVIIGQNKIGTANWISDEASGQELDVRNNLPLGPATNFNTGAGCPGSSAAAPNGTAQCGDPLWVQTSKCNGSTPGFKARTIGTGEEVKATLGTITTGGALPDKIGYSFWGYSNFKPGASGCASSTSGNVTCSNFVGHYLTVNAVDPLFSSPGGSVAGENVTGAYQFPQCGGIQGSAATFQCAQIPFTHLYDGSYPLWTVLRLVTFETSAATATLGGQVVPEGVINVVGFAQSEAAPGSAQQLSDFVPFLSKVTGLPYKQGGAFPTGSLNLGVFRSHYLQSGISPNNGHKGCAPSFNFTAVQIQGGKASAATCLVDTGGDAGGSVLTVQSDVRLLPRFQRREGQRPHVSV